MSPGVRLTAGASSFTSPKGLPAAMGLGFGTI